MISAWTSRKRSMNGCSSKREAVALGLLRERVEDPLLPIDQGAVAVGGDPLDVFELRKGHGGGRGIMSDTAAGGLRATLRMDLLEYQGKQLFAKHGVPVPDGRHAATVDDAVAAAERDRLPVRGQGPGRDRRARQGRRDQGRQGRGRGARARRGDPRHGHPRLHRPRPLDRAGLGDRRRVLRLDHPRPLREEAAGDASRGWAGWTSRRSPRPTPTRWSSATSSPATGSTAELAAGDRRRRRDRRGRHRPGRRDAGQARRRSSTPRTRP